MCACFCLETGLNKFFDTSAHMGISCIKCDLEKVEKQILKAQSLYLSILHTI